MFNEIKQNKSEKVFCDVIKIKQVTEDFFAGVDGKLLDFKYLKIRTYSSHNTKIPCINYYINFTNENLFGQGSFSEEIYPRYRKMRSDWREAVKKSGIDMSQVAIGFVPLLESNKRSSLDKFEYKKELKKPLGEKISKIDNNSPVYYQEMVNNFDVKFILQEDHGFFIGPERGMLYVVEVIIKVLKKIDCFVDVGAGTGELSAYILKNSNPSTVVVNEMSLKLKKHLQKYLGIVSKKNRAKVIFDFNDCQKIKLPDQVDLISVGVFYGSQPSFIESKSKDIIRSLGQEGILLMQSSMPETLFNQHIIMGDLVGIKKWPWYSEKFILSNHFLCVKSFFIDNQFVTIASQSDILINKIIKKLDKKIISYDMFK